MTATVYRVDKFRVPAGVRDEFLAEVLKTHELLRRQPGFRHDLLLEREAGPDELGIVTVAAWDDADSVRAAGEAVAETRWASSFDPAAFMAGLGVTADLGNYREVV